MSNKEFFLNRYKRLGWDFKDVKLRSSIRVNTINADKDILVARLKSLGVSLEKIPFLDDGYWINKSKFSLGATIEYLMGYYSIQEAAAQIPVSLFTKLDKKTVLDACASPGGKTVQLANGMNNKGTIVALDLKVRKMFALTNQLERCRVTNAAVYNMDVREASKLGLKFDCSMLDVPCSGNPITDANWFAKRNMDDIYRNARRQRQILAEVVKVTKDDGEIVYATCSMEPEENELNIDWAIKTLPVTVEYIDCFGDRGITNVFGKKLDRSIKKCRRIWPTQTQGFFVSKLRKRRNA
jgi:tRNA (cytosine40_48-C5)-methyltransferase